MVLAPPQAPLGYANEMKTNVDKTHRLPLPPLKLVGIDDDQLVACDIIAFLQQVGVSCLL